VIDSSNPRDSAVNYALRRRAPRRPL